MNVVSRLAAVAAALSLGAFGTLASHAESLASSASSAGSASVGSISDSVKGSSNSSSGETKTAEGDYRVDAVADAEGRADRVRLTLRPLQPREGHADTVQLDLPRETWAAQGLVAGDRVHIAQRSFGLAFARVERGEPFFLALADDWRDAMAARPLGR